MGEYGGSDTLEKGIWGVGRRDSLEKRKCQANSYTGATVKVNYKLSSFFPMLY